MEGRTRQAVLARYREIQRIEGDLNTLSNQLLQITSLYPLPDTERGFEDKS
jgi:hypothetical protein